MYRLPTTTRAAQARIARRMAIGQRKGRKGSPTQLVCAACDAPWGISSPGDCPSCRRYSYAMSARR